MSPRPNRRRRDDSGPPDEPLTGAFSGPEQTTEWDGADWVVRRVSGSASTKPYRCPGCDQEIRPATPHIVAWPAETGRGLEDRRHWHTPCWGARDRRHRR